MYNEKIILNNFSRGSYGHIYKDAELNIYKITKITDHELLNVSNINEIIILNFLKIIKKVFLNEQKENNEQLLSKDCDQVEVIEQNEEHTIIAKPLIANDEINDINTINNSNDTSQKIDKEKNNCIILYFNPENLIHFDKLNFKALIDENIFMQSISTNYYNCKKLIKNFVFTDTAIANKYFYYLTNNIDRFLLFNKLPNYQLDLTKFIEKNHVYTVNNFDLIAKKILKSVALLHHNGFLHGDLKSPNILINDYNNVCLTDFGAIKINNFNKYHLSCTISSRCPEDLEYEYEKSKYYSNTNSKSDIWSLGLIFTEMILGYNPILKLYQQLDRIKMDSKSLEKKILTYYKSIDYIDILQLIKNNSIKNHINDKHYSQITVIENMLKIDPEKRLSCIEEVYEKLFDEKFNFNYKIDYDYEYVKFFINDNFNILFFFRKEHYKDIIDVCKQLNILYVCPLIIDILDRFFIKILDTQINNIINLHAFESKLFFSAVILIASGIINQSHPDYDQLLAIFKLTNNILNISDINNNLLEILKLMEFDIYRPFNIFYCYHLTENKNCKCVLKINNDDCYTIHNHEEKEKLISILYNIIDDDIIGISPQYYYNKLLS